MTSWQGKRVLVTGAAGFIGSHLAERLVREGAVVRAFTHYNALGSLGWLEGSQLARDMEIVAGDVRDPDSVRAAMKGCDVVFHLAALISVADSYLRPWSYVDTNIGGTVKVLQAARDCGVERLVHTSTSEVYGTARYCPQDEAHPCCAQSPYAGTKRSADSMAEAFHHAYAVPVVTVRPFNTFGDRQSPRAIIPAIIAQLMAGDVVRLGNTAPVRDLNYVANTVDGFLLAGTAPGVEGRVVNLGSGRGVSVGDLVEIIAGLMGHGGYRIEQDGVRVRPAGSEVDRLIADSRLAERLLGWRPKVTLEEGLARTIEWWRARGVGERAAEYAV